MIKVLTGILEVTVHITFFESVLFVLHCVIFLSMTLSGSFRIILPVNT